MTRDELLQKKQKLEEQRKKLEAEFNFVNGQLVGQLTLINELLKESEPKVE